MGDHKPSYLKKRGHSYYWQISVPTALRKALGKAVLSGALHTRDVAEAHARSWVEIAKVKEQFARLQGSGVAAEALPPDAMVTIDDAARTYYRDLLARMAAEARQGTRAWDRPELNRDYDEALEGYVATADFKSVAQPLAAYCEQHAIASGSWHYHRMGDALLNARMHALKGRQLALEGKPSEEPATFLDRLPIDMATLKPLHISRSGLAFADVAARLIAERQRDPEYALTEQSRAVYATIYRLFDSWAGQPRLEDIDRRRASDFIDAISSLDPRWGRSPSTKQKSFAEIAAKFGGHMHGLTAATLNRYVVGLQLVWKFAERRLDFKGQNVWSGQTRRTKKHRGDANSGKRGFTSAEVRKLLELRPSIAFDAASSLRWIILIAAYSACRLEEIASLTTANVRETSGIHYFDLKKAKTEAGVRVVPIHSKIIAAGFLDYCKAIGQGQLWPALRPRKPDGKRGKYITELFVQLRREMGLVEIDKVTGRDRLDFHSLRRSAITALKHADIQEHEVAEVVGHEHPRITYGGYADRGRLERLKAIVEAIQYNH